MKPDNLKTFLIDENTDGQRLDHFLSEQTDLTRSKIQNLIKENKVLCNTTKTKASRTLKEGDTIELYLDTEKKETALFQNSEIKVDVVFEDEDLIVINKPPGLVTHPGAGLENKSVVHAFYDKLYKNSKALLRPGIVHRLDKDTQGLLVLAKNSESLSKLSEQFRVKKAKRTYKALCFGRFKEETGTYKSFLKRDPKNRKKYKSQSDGKEAITHFSVLNEYEISFVEFNLETGRTHQIRVHASEDHHPIVNDPIYGHPKRIKELNDPKLKKFLSSLKNMPLVAIKLSFDHPKSSKSLNFEIPWPKEFEYEDLSN